MNNIRRCAAKKHSDLVLEWDRLAEERHRQISSGADLSFEHVLVPVILDLLKSANTAVLLDIGSGTGDATDKLARVASRVIGIEPSSVSLAVAKASCRSANNVRFVQTPLEEATNLLLGELLTAAVASMTLMTTPDLEDFAKALASLLQNGAKFVATLCHPFFWPIYWGYNKEKWFDYTKEIFIEAPFVISKCCTEVTTTHIHRPLEQYVNVFAKEGFRLETLAEPMPSPKIQALYPQPWRFPRFMALRWVKIG